MGQLINPPPPPKKKIFSFKTFFPFVLKKRRNSFFCLLFCFVLGFFFFPVFLWVGKLKNPPPPPKKKRFALNTVIPVCSEENVDLQFSLIAVPVFHAFRPSVVQHNKRTSITITLLHSSLVHLELTGCNCILCTWISYDVFWMYKYVLLCVEATPNKETQTSPPHSPHLPLFMLNIC